MNSGASWNKNIPYSDQRKVYGWSLYIILSHVASFSNSDQALVGLVSKGQICVEKVPSRGRKVIKALFQVTSLPRYTCWNIEWDVPLGPG